MSKKSLFPKILAVCLIASFVLCGCSGSSSNSGKSSSGEIEVYYLKADRSGLQTQPYKLSSGSAEASDSAACINELLSVMQSDPENTELTRPIPENVTLMSYSFDEEKGVLTLSFNREYAGLDAPQEALVRAAVSQTLLQVEGISGIQFCVGEDPLTDSMGREVGTMTKESFINDLGADSQSLKEKDLVLFYATEDGKNLRAVTRHVHYNAATPLEQVVMEYLTLDPNSDDPKAKAPLSDSAKLLFVSVNEGTCYVSFDNSFQTQEIDVTTDVSVYAIVDSLCQLNNVNQVQITVGGDNVPSTFDVRNVSGTYSPNYDLVVNSSGTNP